MPTSIRAALRRAYRRLALPTTPAFTCALVTSSVLPASEFTTGLGDFPPHTAAQMLLLPLGIAPSPLLLAGAYQP